MNEKNPRDEFERVMSDQYATEADALQEKLEADQERLISIKNKFIGLSRSIEASLTRRAEALDAGHKAGQNDAARELSELGTTYRLYQDEFNLTNLEMDELETKLDEIAAKYEIPSRGEVGNN
jgi:hypothetical protein